MSGDALENLVAIASAPLSHLSPDLGSELLSGAGKHGRDLFRLLRTRNGFYCFESSLHVFPAKSIGERIGLDRWNSSDLWKEEYGALLPAGVFFAQDIFGCQ